MLRFILIASLAVFLRIPVSLAEERDTSEVRSELKAATQQLGEIMRQDVEQINVDDQNIIEVPLTNTTPGGTIYKSMGALVPFVVEGVGGGNSEQEFIALFKIISPDEQMLQDFGAAGNPHKHVGLLAFTQLDNRGPVIPSWQDAVIEPGIVTVPVAIHNCNRRHGMMIMHVDANWFGPRISLTFDAGATLGPTACIRP